MAGRKQISPLPALLAFDANLWVQIKARCPNAKYLIGLDEVGRGSLIDSVVGGAVCWKIPEGLEKLNALAAQVVESPINHDPKAENQNPLVPLQWLNDSKKLTAPVREQLSVVIPNVAIVGLGEASKSEIERLNIHHASLLALARAFENVAKQLNVSPFSDECFLIMDGRSVMPDYAKHRQLAIVKGDGLSSVIAAASVMAKHSRDTHIRSLATLYPGYGWENNMGYAAPAHLKGIEEKGLTPLHRRNFRVVAEQLTLELPAHAE